jgi:hypothetical protein
MPWGTWVTPAMESIDLRMSSAGASATAGVSASFNPL